jgi:hypothetical protein
MQISRFVRDDTRGFWFSLMTLRMTLPLLTSDRDLSLAGEDERVALSYLLC